MFVKAKKRKEETGKPLLVVGEPGNGAWNKTFGHAYGCGDLCLDISGCHSCKNSVAAPLEEQIRKMKTNSCVIYVSCTLEYMRSVSHLREVEHHLQRVSGGDLFIVHIQPYSLISFVYEPRQIPKWRIFKAPPYSKKIRYSLNPIYRLFNPNN
jgi:hypothetical protein